MVPHPRAILLAGSEGDAESVSRAQRESWRTPTGNAPRARKARASGAGVLGVEVRKRQADHVTMDLGRRLGSARADDQGLRRVR